jgi:hypothetical protein
MEMAVGGIVITGATLGLADAIGILPIVTTYLELESAADGVPARMTPLPTARPIVNPEPLACPVAAYGPYHRRGVTAETMEKILRDGELLGNPSRNYMPSPFPKVKAYDGPLPDGWKGFEFMTNVAPDAGHVPGQPVWGGP